MLYYLYYKLYYLFLTFILITQVNNLYYDFSHTETFQITLSTFPQNSRSYCVFVVFHSEFTFSLWRLRRKPWTHDSTKISLPQAYMTQHSHDIICLTETFLNSSIQSDDDRITIGEYNLIKSDHPSDLKKSGSCIYYKEQVPLILR